MTVASSRSCRGIMARPAVDECQQPRRLYRLSEHQRTTEHDIGNEEVPRGRKSGCKFAEHCSGTFRDFLEQSVGGRSDLREEEQRSALRLQRRGMLSHVDAQKRRE